MTKTQTLIQQLLEVRQPIPIDQLKRQIIKWFGQRAEEIEVTRVGLSAYVNILIDKVPISLSGNRENSIDPDKFDDNVLKNSGWHVSSVIKTVYSDENSPDLYEYSLDLEASLSVKIKKPRFLYHITRTRYAEKIMRNGLKPKIQTEGHLRFPEPRIYLFLKGGLSDGDSVFANGNVTVFRVDTKKFDRFNIYEDDRIPGGDAVWTPTHIPVSAIKKLISGDALYWTELLQSIEDEENIERWS